MRLHNETNYDIRILQQKIIGNLEAIDRVCREHGLRYYLWAGTMLGAVRHKGFIPWDDDMDICMPRPDYEQSAYVCDYDDGLRGCIEKRLLGRFSITSSAST